MSVIHSQPASDTCENLDFPVLPLIATLAMQSLATIAAYSFPVVAPVIEKDIEVPGTLVGFFISTVYGVGIISALLSPRTPPRVMNLVLSIRQIGVPLGGISGSGDGAAYFEPRLASGLVVANRVGIGGSVVARVRAPLLGR